MNFTVRVTMPMRRFAAQMGAAAAARAGRSDAGSRTVPIRLPSTSNIRDPSEIAALSQFDEPARIEE